MLILHYAPNTISLAALIALEEAGAAYRPVRLDFSAAEQRGADYLKVNPKGRVPALVTGRGILTETPALLSYVAQSYPDAELAPLDDPYLFARLQSFMAYLCSTVHPSHSMRLRGARWSDDPAVIEALKVKVATNVAHCNGIIEAELFEGPWVMGGQYSIADPYLFTINRWMEADGVDPEDFPVLADHRRRMIDRPAVQRALAVEATT
jgi:glutathione S-transferase